MLTAGQQLRQVRLARKLTVRMVARMSRELAHQHRNDEFYLTPSRLSEIERRDATPSIYKLYSLAAIYGIPYVSVLQLYGIDLTQIEADLLLLQTKSASAGR
jgi:transcriptional regulator with XRE-family HTH domain